MDEKTYQKRLERLKKVNDALKVVDVSIRSAAFDLLKGYITGQLKTPSETGAGGAEERKPNGGDIEEFFSSREEGKPAYNAKLIAAYYYSLYGGHSFSVGVHLFIRRIQDF